MQDWIKTVGSEEFSYTQEVHSQADQRFVYFPVRSTSIRPGDRLFLYTGAPLQRFFGVVLVSGEAEAVDCEDLPLRLPVFVQLMVRRLEFGLPAKEVFPLPSGRELVSLRQQSHVAIDTEDAARLIARIVVGAQREMMRHGHFVEQVGLFGLGGNV